MNMIYTWLPFICLVWVAATASTSLQPSSPPPINDLLPYFARDFYDHRYLCSPQERECMKRGKLLYETDGECYSVGERGPCAEGRTFHAELQEAMRIGGHLRGTCESVCEDDSQAPFVTTGECLTRSQVESQFCRNEWYLSPVKDAFGQWVCEWTELPCKPGRPPRRIESKGGRYSDPYNGLCYPPYIFLRVGGNNSTSVVHPPNHPLLSFFTNNSYVGREYPCTEAERECLQLGRLLHSDGNCYGVKDTPWGYNQLFLDWDEVMVQGNLSYSGRNSPIYKMSIDHPLISVCNPVWGMRVEADVFGRLVCKCSSEEPYAPPITDSPASPGFCRAPDFNYPARSPEFDRALILGFLVPCTEEEFACLRENRVLVGGACHALRTQGPCAEGQELLLDRDALRHGRLQAVCKTRSCPVGSVLMPYNGRCFTHEQVSSLLCEGEAVTLDDFGEWQCSTCSGEPVDLAKLVRHANSTCELPPQE